MNNKVILAALALGGGFFLFKRSKDSPKEIPGLTDQMFFDLEPGKTYTIFTFKNGQSSSYREEVGEPVSLNVGQTMRNGGDLVRVELAS